MGGATDRRAGAGDRLRRRRRGRPRVTGVRTDQGDVEAEVVVNCAGQWAKALGDLVGVTVPLHSAEHFYVVTEAIEGIHPDLPIMRDPDGWTYFKEEVGGLVVGGFEPEAKPWRSPDDLPYPFEFQLLEEDWDHFSVLMDEALLRVPALAETGIRKFYNGPGVVHARQPVPARRGARARRLLRRRRLQLGRHRVRRRRRPRAGGVDRGRASRPGRPGRRRRTPVRAVPRRQRAGCAPGSRRCSGCTTPCRGPTASSSRHARSGVSPLHDTAGRRGRGLRHPDGLGAPQRLRPAGAPSTTPGASRRGCRGRPPSSARPAPAWRSSTRRRSRKYVVAGPGRARRRCSGSAPPTSTCRSDGCVYTPFLNAPRHLRGRPDRHPDRRRRVPARLELGHDRARPRLAAPAAPGGSTSACATSPPTSPCSA